MGGRCDLAPRRWSCRPRTTCARWAASPPSAIRAAWAPAGRSPTSRPSNPACCPAQRWDFSEDNLVTRSGYGPFRGGAYQWGGWDFMAVAYLTRWAGPVNETDDRYYTPVPPKTNVARKHVQGVVMLPGRTGFLDNDLLKQMVVENGALSVGMFYADEFDAFDSSAADAAATAVYYCDLAAGDTFAGTEVGENHGVAVVGWDDTFPAARFADTGAGDAAGRRCVPRPQQLGRRMGRPRLLLGLVLRPLLRLRRLHELRARRTDRQLHAQLSARHPRLDLVAGLRGRRRSVDRLGRQPFHREGRRAHRRRRLLRAGGRHPVPGLGRPVPGLADAARQRDAYPARLRHGRPGDAAHGAQAARSSSSPCGWTRRATPGRSPSRRPPRRGRRERRRRPDRASCATATATRGWTSPPTPPAPTPANVCLKAYARK